MPEFTDILRALADAVIPTAKRLEPAQERYEPMKEPSPPTLPPPVMQGASFDVPPLVAARQQDPVSDFLDKIGRIESGNDDSALHGVIKQGINKGTRAVGRYGLTPLTITSTLRDLQRRGEESPVVVSLPALPPTPPKGLKAQKKEATELASQLTPEQTSTLAYFLAQQVIEKAGGDQERAALMWNSGINLPQRKLTGAFLDKHEYVKRFRTLEQRQSPGVPQLQEESRVHPGAVANASGENVFRSQRLLDEMVASRLARRYKER